MKTVNLAYELSWFDKSTGNIAGSEDLLKATHEDVCNWFGLSEHDEPIDCYDVTSSQVGDLQGQVKEPTHE